MDRVYDFLAGLNPKFDVVRSRILGTRPVPSSMEVCSEIRLEEDRSNAMNNPVTKSTDSAAFKVSGTDKQNGKVPPVCEHCKKLWHTKEQCWKVHGRPPNGKRRQSGPGRALASESTAGHQPHNQETSQNDSIIVGVSAIAQSGSELGDDD
ncbi:uncharacterized protein LOC120067757 [Benincasa hispida]|uniref:uncharacterized protein LOC120067757 n=1 Tax=Benincasa hispida TaxID=102211 RepID=UPI0019010EF1|nr:uncharacterized protein LOC120067757 [Benincasa hispida]